MELSKEQQKIISKLPKGEYKVEIIGMHNRPLTAKEIKENYQRWLGDNGKEARN